MPKTTTSSKWAPPCKGLVLQNRFPILGFASGVLTKITQNPLITMDFLQGNNPYIILSHINPMRKSPWNHHPNKGETPSLVGLRYFPMSSMRPIWTPERCKDLSPVQTLSAKDIRDTASYSPGRSSCAPLWELNGRHTSNNCCVYGGWYMGVIKWY